MGCVSTFPHPPSPSELPALLRREAILLAYLKLALRAAREGETLHALQTLRHGLEFAEVGQAA